MAGAWICFQCLETQAFQAILGNNDTRQVAFSIYICLIWSNHQLERFTNYAYIVHSFYFGTWVHAGCIGYTNGLAQNTNHTTISWNKRQDLKLSIKIRREQTSEPDWLAIYYDLNLHRLYHSFKSSSMPVWQSGKTRMWSLLKPSLFVVRFSRILATCRYWARLSQQHGEKSPSAYNQSISKQAVPWFNLFEVVCSAACRGSSRNSYCMHQNLKKAALESYLLGYKKMVRCTTDNWLAGNWHTCAPFYEAQSGIRSRRFEKLHCFMFTHSPLVN